MKLKDRNIKGILLDITGVLYESGNGFGTVIPGSVDAVHRIKEKGIPFRLVTNETTVSVENLVTKLQYHGFEIESSHIFSPIPAVKSIIKQRNLHPHILVHKDVVDEFKDLEQDNPTCVIIGDADEGFNFQNMNAAFNVLMNMDQRILFSLGKGKYYRHSGNLQLDIGAFTTALEFACDIQANVVGKPSPNFFNAAIKDMGVEANEAVMVGDDIMSDVGGAQACNIAGVLVKTGKFTESNLSHPKVKPDLVADNLCCAIQSMLN